MISNFFEIVMKRLYGRFNGKLFPILSYFGCYFVFVFLLLVKKKNQIVLAPTAAIGDTLYIFSFLKSLGEWAERENKEILFFSSDRYKNIVETYDKPDLRIKIRYLKHVGFAHLFLLMIGGCKDHYFLNNFSKKCGIFMPIPNAYKDYFSRNCKPTGTRHQLAHILGVSLMPISLHNLPVVPVKSVVDFDKNKDKICILNPYSYSMYTSLLLFEKLAEELKKKGYIVYTNIVKGQKVIEGTFELDCDLRELYSISKQIPLIVSLRSGILDYLIPSSINMFVVYNKWKVSFIQDEDYSLEEWQPKGIVYEAHSNSMSDDEIVQKFQDFLTQLKFEEQI